MTARGYGPVPPPVEGATWLPLPGSDFFLVDDVDLEIFDSPGAWHALRNAGRAYVRRWIRRDGKQAPLNLHRLVAERAGMRIDGLHVDHINGDTLDNRRSNLRPATASQNGANRRRLRSGTGSEFKGVGWRAHKRRWRATIVVQGQERHLGLFRREQVAAAAYDQAAIEAFGPYAATNASLGLLDGYDVALLLEEAKRDSRAGLGRSSPGECNRMSKLRGADIPRLLERVAAGETMKSVAESLNVSKSAVFSVVRGRTWRHVSGLSPAPAGVTR